MLNDTKINVCIRNFVNIGNFALKFNGNHEYPEYSEMHWFEPVSISWLIYSHSRKYGI